MNGRVAIAAGLVVAVILSAVAFTNLRKDEIPIPLYVVREGVFDRHVTAEGSLEAVEATPITPPVEVQDMLKVGWIAEDQSPVHAGDPIVRFDPTDLEKMMSTGVDDRSTAGNKIIKLGADTSAARNNLGRDAGQAQRELQSAREFHLDDPDIFSRYQVIESGIDEDLAARKKEFADGMLRIRERLANADRQLLSIDERKAALKIGQAERGLKSLTVTAPHDGVLVLKRDWRGEIPRVGSSVWSGQTLGEIPRSGKMKAEVFVLEADSGGIAVGQKAKVRLESDRTKAWDAVVDRIDKVAKPRYRNVPVQYFGVTLALQQTNETIMKPGARVSATIDLAHEKQAITIPREALFEKNGSKIVYVQTGGKFIPTPVETGIASAGRILISRGLAAGTRIALRDPLETQERDRGNHRPDNESGR
ncbi:MAG: efflux RND transporter periplasmic adaptor subunit [Acidobacteriota bacterium]